MLLLLNGCALQTGAGAVHHAPGHASGAAWDLEGRFVDVLGRNNAYAGGHVVLADPGRDAHFGARRVSVGAGYRALNCCVTFEIGGELGAGEPTHVEYDGLGFYTGGVGTVLLRVFGDQDVERGFAPVGVMLDLGVGGRAGAWFPPRDTPDPILFEGGMHGAARLTIISDLFDATGGEIER